MSKRKQFTPEQKIAMVRRHLLERVSPPPAFVPVRVRESGSQNQAVFWRVERSETRKNTAGRKRGGGTVV